MDPQKYQRGYSFSGYQATNPKSPVPAPPLDNELENIELAIGQSVDAIKSIRRSDGKLANEIVLPESLSAAALAYIQGTVKTLYVQASALIETATGYLGAMTTARDVTFEARDDAREAATDAAYHNTVLVSYLYDFNLGGDVADADWND